MNNYWKNDTELFAIAKRELLTAVVGDTMDKLKLQHQFLPPEIRPSDILFGDIDGVCVIPAEAEEEVFVRVIEKARGEKLVKAALLERLSSVKAFEKFGIM